MASEYSLQLKAVLDTSDVQQKLNQLKQQQQGTSSGNGGLGNGGIQQALQRLNTTLTNLQHSIDKLSAQQGKHAVVSSGSTYALSGSGAFKNSLYTPKEKIDFSSRAAKMFKEADKNSEEYKKFNAKREEQFYQSRIKRDLNPPSRRSLRTGSGNVVTAQALALQGRYRLQNIETWKGNALSQSAISSRQNLMTNSPGVKQELEGRHRLQNIETWKGTLNKQKLTPEAKANLRMGAGLVFGTIAGGVENYAQATGNKNLATGASFVKQIGYGAATGAMVGGPIGAVIGGSVGALNAAFEELAGRARDAAEALEGQAARVRSGRRFDIEMKDFEQQRQDKEMLKKQTSGTAEERTEAGNYFRKQLDEAKKKYDSVRANMEKTGVAAEGGVEAYEKRTKELLELRGQDDAEVKQRQKTADIYKDQFYWLQKHSNRIEQLEDIVPKAQKAREFATSRFGMNPEDHPEIKDWTRYGAMGGVRGLAAAEQAKSLREALSNLKAPDMANVNSLASQGFMISAADDEARLDEANKHLTDLVNLTRQIKDKENEAATYG